jgi:galactose mutarotase-like enzyme
MLPWARRLTGTSVAATAGGDKLVQAEWQGQTLRVPSDPPGSTTSVDGLLQQHASDSLQTEVLRDGQSAQAVFHPVSVTSQWPSSLEVLVQVELEAQDLDLTMTAKNTGSQPMPIGAGWQPAFALPTASRSRVMLTIPSTTVTEVDPATARPSGRTLSVAHTALDFSSPVGTTLGKGAINQTYTDLQTAPAGTAADLRDPSIDLLLRLVALTPNINSLHVVAPLDRAWVSISPNTNLDDPLGPEWTQRSSGLVTLAPGETMQWKVRLEIARLSTLGEPK